MVARRDVTINVACPQERHWQLLAPFQVSLKGLRVIIGRWGSFCVPRTALLVRCWALLKPYRSTVGSPHRAAGAAGLVAGLGAVWVGGSWGIW